MANNNKNFINNNENRIYKIGGNVNRSLKPCEYLRGDRNYIKIMQLFNYNTQETNYFYCRSKKLKVNI